MAVLLVADHDNSTLAGQTARALTAALALGDAVDILVVGADCRQAAAEAAALSGVRRVRLAEGAVFAQLLAEPVADLIVALAPDYDAIVAPATANGKNILPRAAALLDVAQISEIIAVVGARTFKRPIYAGNAVETVETTDAKLVLTVRAAAFEPAAAGGGTAPIEPIAVSPGAQPSRFVSTELGAGAGPDLASAKIVVAGGRAFGSAEKFDELLRPLAKKLGAAIGASRAAVDAGYAPNDWQVGQTGKIVAPELYIACGISGAIQHLAGMKDAKIIVAINSDPDAPIFSVADYGLVGDLFTLLPEIERLL